MDFSDLAPLVRGYTASDPKERSELVSCVQTVHRRSTAVIDAVFRGAAGPRGTSDSRLFFVNGDHNHMTAAVSGFVQARPKGAALPIVVNVDLHSDARPSSDGPHSGTWCAEVCGTSTMAQA